MYMVATASAATSFVGRDGREHEAKPTPIVVEPADVGLAFRAGWTNLSDEGAYALLRKAQ